jgi:hypothetical protein
MSHAAVTEEHANWNAEEYSSHSLDARASCESGGGRPNLGAGSMRGNEFGASRPSGDRTGAFSGASRCGQTACVARLANLGTSLGSPRATEPRDRPPKPSTKTTPTETHAHGKDVGLLMMRRSASRIPARPPSPWPCPARGRRAPPLTRQTGRLCRRPPRSLSRR